MKIVRETNLGLGKLRRGKVRDCYDLEPYILLVVTDRISAFDVVMPEGIPYKGKVLNNLSAFWFKKTAHIVENHVETTDIDRIIERYPALDKNKALLEGRTTLGRRAEPVPVECVVRGYLAGSAYKEYMEKGTVAEIPMPRGMKRSQKFNSPLFTPATKAESGHDENISVQKMKDIVGAQLTGRIIKTSLELYNCASEYAAGRGILIADTKFEFGLLDGKLVLIDEMLTPDSSRFWLAADYKPGVDQKGFDKQPLRDWLEKLVAQGKWHKAPPGPELPEEIVSYMSKLYLKSYNMLTGEEIN
ncbi:MAG TPA: phosphoribosylaminoimidazolesuccinocarboxamide synthase [archaeon]|nr:phosphoribosylaminoimidazolesuccinocarboxamide synthase [archaeon]